jgi:hypothetical protein
MGIALQPLLPWPWIAALAAAGLLLLLLGLRRRLRGTWLRGAALAAGLVVLLNPALLREQRALLDDVAVVVMDESPSQDIGARRGRAADALAVLRARLGALEGLELRITRSGAPTATASRQDGTRLFSAVEQALADVPPSRVAGVVLVTDGQVHDVPTELPFDAPLHALLTGAPDEAERRLVIVQAPRYGVVGERLNMTVRVEDLGAAPEAPRASVHLRLNGGAVSDFLVPIGQDHEIPLTLPHAGESVVEIEATAGPRELTLDNNRAILSINGVRDRLRVLLVSGEPHPGERTWRDLLKADPSVDLVHFTILRPPEKQDGTPINQLSLISFPTTELFVEKLHQFDLIIFDRYRQRGVLPITYLGNIVRYVEAGGALLSAAGPDFATPLSLYHTPLAAVLPGRPTGAIHTGGFRAQITAAGQRHPVTADLPRTVPPQADGTPNWGRWFRLIDADPTMGDVVMAGPDERPLLLLARIGQGRVAQLLSDHTWLWARGFEGGGPQAELLRRTAHWLMKEPDLEEEHLSATSEDGRNLTIRRRSMAETVPPVTLIAPSGATRVVRLAPEEPGRWTATVPVAEQGIWHLDDTRLQAVAAVGRRDRLEYGDMRTSAALLAPVVEASGGGIIWLAEDGVPQIRRTRGQGERAGAGWIGLKRTGSETITAVDQVPLVPPALALAGVLGLLLLGWRREGR